MEMEVAGGSEEDEKSYRERNNIRLRQYQIKLIEVAEKQNTIIFLPTGSGKTFIALWIIKSKSGDIRKPYKEGGKRTFFLVNTKALVDQQASVIEEMTDLTVGRYTGDLNVDLWNKSKWLEELEKHQVMVMTAQILLNMLMTGYISLSNINFMVFDEVHHAVNDHPYRADNGEEDYWSKYGFQIMKQFENVPKSEQPLVLGLSATLLNGNPSKKDQSAYVHLKTAVEKYVAALETTIQGTVATSEELSEVLQYSTCPLEKAIPCKSVNKDEAYIQVMNIYDEAIEYLKKVLFPSDEEDLAVPAPPDCERYKKGNSMSKTVKNNLEDARRHLELLGHYGGAVAALYHIIQFEKLRIVSDNDVETELLSYVILTLNKARRILVKSMPRVDTYENVVNHSSPKVERLLTTLLEKKDSVEKRKEPLACIVFVERRVTAIVLCHVIKILCQPHRELNFIKPDFMVGGQGNPMKDTRECLLDEMRCDEVIKRFASSEINLLVATNVVEEGIDLRECNLVIKFDKPNDYRSYVQSKGRARAKVSEYFMYTDLSEYGSFENRRKNYQDTEIALKELLIGKSEYREAPTEDQISGELYYTDIAPYYVDGPESAHVSGEAAIQLVDRYCQMLPQDFYSLLSPYVWMKRVGDKRVAVLQLPITCPLRENIEGDPQVNSKLAKRSVFMKAVEKLHKMKELTDDLLPTKRVINVDDYKYLFPYYVNEKIDKDLPQPGTKQRVQKYSVKYAECLSNCLPKPGVTLYLHVIITKPIYEKQTENRKKTIFEMLDSSTGYAMLSTKPLSKICGFPVILKAGQVRCNLLVNASTVVLNSEEIEQIKNFHFNIFTKLLDLVRESYAFDNSNKENSFFIVPVDKDSTGKFSILWDIVRKRDSFPARFRNYYGPDNSVIRILDSEWMDYSKQKEENGLRKRKLELGDEEVEPIKKKQSPGIRSPTYEERLQMKITKEKYNLTVVVPYYRASDTYYLVTAVCDDMTPMSKFPENYDTYYDYFDQRYQIKIAQKKQPLLEVKALSSSYNFIKPRHTAKTGGIRGKKKRQEEGDGFDEHLVPELCTHFSYPAGLWLKATLLPTILYRIMNFYTIDEFRKEIARETKLGFVELPSNASWADLEIDELCLKGQEEKLETDTNLTINRPILNARACAIDVSKRNAHIWGLEQLPIDIERRMNEVSPCDLQYYMKFISKPLSKESAAYRISPTKMGGGDDTRSNVPALRNIHIIDLDIIKPKNLLSGPQLADLIHVFTTNKANDICSLERLETLGDSFLKFATALFSFREFDYDEGKLVSLKDKIVGNKNLMYCARAKNFAPLINVNDFTPRSEWNPPLFKVPAELAEGITSKNLELSAICKLYIPPDEQLSGNLSSETKELIQKILKEAEPADKSSTMELLLSKKTIADKTVADCTEALIGCYLRSCGIQGGFILLKWLGVMPKATYEKLIQTPIRNAYLSGTTNDHDVYFHLNKVDYRTLERTLGYTFNEKSFLLEALTHSSYVKNRLTYNYQRLEFLGDAILDFLITCYIYEHCGNLTPGKVTDLRSALVNNVTFACLAVRYNFHKYLLSLSASLMDPIDRFVKYQISRNHEVDEAVMILLDDRDCKIAEAVEVPKVLGDIFESLAGAIFLDSGNSLEAVWKVFYPLMKNEIDAFSCSTPKQPVRLLYEALKHKPSTKNFVLEEGPKAVMTQLDIIHNGEQIQFHGFGSNKSLAKRSAAKHALKYIKESDNTSD